ncbi:GntR family transcriptional regulator [Alicyclobacillus sp. ALC3]|nr:GntR family transcriptional regulator [Alicyclobacillus sp. ALC3]
MADGSLDEGQRGPSSNELATYYQINPTTAVKGINLLVEQSLLTKDRGIGMFVTTGARERILQLRRRRFAKD